MNTSRQLSVLFLMPSITCWGCGISQDDASSLLMNSVQDQGKRDRVTMPLGEDIPEVVSGLHETSHRYQSYRAWYRKKGQELKEQGALYLPVSSADYSESRQVLAALEEKGLLRYWGSPSGYGSNMMHMYFPEESFFSEADIVNEGNKQFSLKLCECREDFMYLETLTKVDSLYTAEYASRYQCWSTDLYRAVSSHLTGRNGHLKKRCESGESIRTHRATLEKGSDGWFVR